MKTKEIDFDNRGLDDIFFEEFFPCVEGHAALINEFYSNINAPMCETVHNDKIKFHDPESADPDWLVKQCYLLMIAAVCEADKGVSNL